MPVDAAQPGASFLAQTVRSCIRWAGICTPWSRPRQQCRLRQRPGLPARRAAADRDHRRLRSSRHRWCPMPRPCRAGSRRHSQASSGSTRLRRSGAPLSQYLILAGHAVARVRRRAAVINVVGNDFDESLAAYKSVPGFWLYAPDSVGHAAAAPDRARAERALVALARHSALARYVIINLRFQESRLAHARARRRPFPDIGACGTALCRQYRRVEPTKAGEGFARRARCVLSRSARTRRPAAGPRVVHARRLPLRRRRAGWRGARYFDLMRQAFIEQGPRRIGYEVIDLDPRFIPRHARTGRELRLLRRQSLERRRPRGRGRGGAGVRSCLRGSSNKAKHDIDKPGNHQPVRRERGVG